MAAAKPNRPVYALLGATGSTGSEVLLQLLDRDPSSLHINVYVRSKSRLVDKFLDIEQRQNVSIFVGSMTSESILSCLRDASFIINTIGTNSPSPTMTLAQDTAKVIVEALRNIAKDRTTLKTPHMIYLSSGSLSKIFSEDEPWIARKFLYNGLWYIYEDIRHATIYYRSEGVATGLMTLTLACPGALIQGSDSANAVHGEGVQLSLREHTAMVTYAELARGIIKMAEDGNQWRGKEVLLQSAQPGDLGQLATLAIKNIMPGLIISYIPAMYPLLVKIGVF